MATTAWLIGSTELGLQSLFNASDIPAGSYYLYDAVAPSLLAAVVAAMVADSITGAAAVLLQNRKIKISATGTFAITWPSDHVLRDLLGYSADLSGASSYTAPLISPLLWSPARTESPQLSPLGTLGHTIHNTIFGVGDDGSTVATTHGSRIFQEFTWGYVEMSRIQTASALGGEFVTFFDECLKNGYRWKLYRAVAEDTSSTATVSLPTNLGPYAMTPSSRTPDWSFRRSAGFESVDGRCDITVPGHVVPEIST